MLDHCNFEGLLVICPGTCTKLLEILSELYGTKVLDEVPFICPSTKELLQICAIAVNLDVSLNIFSSPRELKSFVVFCEVEVLNMCKAGPLV